MLKPLGILLLIATCTAVGFFCSGKLQRAASSTRQLTMLLQDFLIHIRYQCLPLEELLWLLSNHPNYRSLQFLRAVSENFSASEHPTILWKKAVAEDDAVIPAAKEILYQLGNVLGTTETAGQIAALELHLYQMQKLCGDVQDAYQKKGGLYQKLGILTGILFAVLLF